MLKFSWIWVWVGSKTHVAYLSPCLFTLYCHVLQYSPNEPVPRRKIRSAKSHPPTTVPELEWIESHGNKNQPIVIPQDMAQPSFCVSHIWWSSSASPTKHPRLLSSVREFVSVEVSWDGDMQEPQPQIILEIDMETMREHRTVVSVW